MSNHEIIESSSKFVCIELDQPFNLSFGTLSHLPRVLYSVKALENGKIVEGIGEASIDFPFSHYDAFDIYQALKGSEIVGQDLADRFALLCSHSLRRRIMMETPAAFAALNMAIDDLFGKIAGTSVLDLYGQERQSGRALGSISFQEQTDEVLRQIKEKVSNGFIPKPKVGQGIERDSLTIKALDRIAVDNRIPYVLDFNAKYSATDFLELLNLLKTQGCSFEGLLFIEQPTQESEGVNGIFRSRVAFEDIFGKKTDFVADESFVSQKDALQCGEMGISLNFKIQKVGGLLHAHEIEQALAIKGFRDVKSLVGGTFPTAIGRTYDQQSASVLRTASLPGDGWQPSTDWFKGEKHIIKEDFSPRDRKGLFAPIKGYGLGITPDWEKIDHFVIEHPEREYTNIRNNKSGDRIKMTLLPGQKYSELYMEKTGRDPNWNL